jgi:Protein of unknown function (DUF3168)
MSWEKGLFEFLHTNVDIYGIVGNDIYFSTIPKGASFPAIVIDTVTTQRETMLEATAPQQDRRVRFRCVSAVDQYGARALAKALVGVLVDYTGTLPDGTVVNAAIFNLDADLPYEIGAKGFAFAVLLDLSFFITEPS